MIQSLGNLSNKFVNVSAAVTNNTDKNVTTTHQAADMVNSIKESAEKCSGYMEKLTKAMIEINEASHDIVNITKTISSIASRTNILAINASIEAARAGEAGKGFAVVAGEVKNLAKQSSKSVSDTNALINNSIAKAELGMQIANDTAESLAKIVVGISSSNELISEISKSTETQKDAVADINSGARQMASILSSGETKYLN
jgi:methyl-accepting chemotaxis protein